ncbi:MAG: hypothetical protein WBH05_00385, partial [Syntrophobacteria bacterium]
IPAKSRKAGREPGSIMKESYAWIPDHDFVVSGMTAIAVCRDHLPVALPNCLSYTVSPKPYRGLGP